MMEQAFAEFGGLDFVEGVQRFASDIGESAPAEIRHDSAPFVEGIPEAAGPVRSNARGVIRDPLPGEHALARASNGIEQKNGVRVGRQSPVIENVELSAPADELVGADVARFGVEGWGLWDGVAVLKLAGSAFSGGLCDFVQVTPETGSGMDRFSCKLLKTVEGRVNPMHERAGLHLFRSLAKCV